MKNIIFDKKGIPSLIILKDAYLASCSRNLYAGYVENDRVHDFNGTQRGWLKEGILRDLYGNCVGFMENANGTGHPALPLIKTLANFSKPTPSDKPLRPVSQEKPFPLPMFKKTWADTNPTTLMIP